MARALSGPGPSALCRARAARGRRPRPTVGQANSGPRCSSLFDAMARLQQSERVLYAWPELGFGLEAI
jgi:hypothetical protein